MNKQELGKKIYEIANIKGEFKLRSGDIASEYFDKYLFESDPVILGAVAKHLVNLLPNSYDYLAGLEMGGIPVTTALSLESGVKTLFVRKEEKKYGTCNLAEGGSVDGSRLVIIEDVVTSGGAIIDSVTALREKGAIISHAICVIDREETGKQNLESIGLQFKPLFTKSELISLATYE